MSNLSSRAGTIKEAQKRRLILEDLGLLSWPSGQAAADTELGRMESEGVEVRHPSQGVSEVSFHDKITEDGLV